MARLALRMFPGEVSASNARYERGLLGVSERTTVRWLRRRSVLERVSPLDVLHVQWGDQRSHLWLDEAGSSDSRATSNSAALATISSLQFPVDGLWLQWRKQKNTSNAKCKV